MKTGKKVIFYVATTGIFVVLTYIVVLLGNDLEDGKMEMNQALESSGLAEKGSWEIFQRSFSEALHHPLGALILQILSILFFARLFGYLFTKIRQPTVIGDIVAGIVLGPSILGWLLPGVSAFIFPEESLGNLQFLSHVGLILFMFIIGMELDFKALRNKVRDAVVISHVSIIIPYFLGVLLAYFLYDNFATDTTSFLSFALFMGITMSITAFPVLARVIQNRGFSRSHLGTVVITCAAADDITAWCLLAAVIAIVKAGSFTSAIFTAIIALSYMIFMLKVLQPFLKRLGNVYSAKETINKTVVAVVFLVLLLSSYLTEIIGIHALFGAFMAGIIMPPNLNFRKILAEKIEDVALVLLLPLFFVFTGLRTEIGLLNSWHLWGICFWIIFVALTGKFGGSALAARFIGQSWKNSLTIGALMNTRGLMELVVLNIGFDLNVLSSEIFTMLVIMTLLTTFMTSPAMDLIDKLFKKEDKQAEIPASTSTDSPIFDSYYKVLLAFGPAKKGVTLLGLADQMTFKTQEKVAFTALHLTPDIEIDLRNAIEYKRKAFEPIRKRASLLGVHLDTIHKVSEDVTREITRHANKKRFDLLMVGASQSLFSKDKLGGKVKSYLDDVECDVGVLIDRNFQFAKTIVFLVSQPEDMFIMDTVRQFIKNNSSFVTIGDVNHVIAKDNWIWNEIVSINEEKAGTIEFDNIYPLEMTRIKQADLILMSHVAYQNTKFFDDTFLQNCPSILVLKKGKSSIFNHF